MPNVKSKSLTLAAIERLAIGEKTASDASAPGLYVMRNRDGSRSWRWRRVVAGKAVQRVRGTTLEFNLPQARAWALDLNRQVAEGVDLDAVKREEERAIEVEREAVAAQTVIDRVEADRLATTVRSVWETYIANLERRGHKDGRYATKTLAMKRCRFDNDILPAIGDKPISDVKLRDLKAIVEAKEKAGLPSASNHLVPDLKHFFTAWADDGDDDDPRLNPATKLKRLCSTPPRDRTFSPAEVRLFVKALGASKHDFTRRFFTLLLLSAQRLENVLAATPKQWCDETDAWEIPTTKNGEPNVVPLGPWGKSLFQRDGVWLFPARRTKSHRVGGLAEIRSRLNVVMLKLAPEGTEIEHWTQHDFRRTATTGMNRLGVTSFITERVLAHTLKGVEGIYNRYEYLPEKRDALARWEAYIIKIAREEGVAEALGIPAEPRLALAA